MIDSIRRNASARAEELFTQPIDVLFYDTTTLYFQSDREDYGQNKDPLRFKGYSKDGKAASNPGGAGIAGDPRRDSAGL